MSPEPPPEPTRHDAEPADGTRRAPEPVAAPLEGVRFSRVRLTSDGRLWFRGLSYGSWTPARTRAVCDHRDHDAPQFDCTCGLWFCADNDTLEMTTEGLTRACCTVGVVAWGRVIEHDHGWRAEHLEVRSVVSPAARSCVDCGGDADRLRSTSGVLRAVCGTCDAAAPTIRDVEAHNAVTVTFTGEPNPAAPSAGRTLLTELFPFVVFAVLSFVSLAVVLTYVVGDPHVDGDTITMATDRLGARLVTFAAIGVIVLALAAAFTTHRRRWRHLLRFVPLIVVWAILIGAAAASAADATTTRAAGAFIREHQLVVLSASDDAPDTYLLATTDGDVCDVTFTDTGPDTWRADGDCVDDLLTGG